MVSLLAVLELVLALHVRSSQGMVAAVMDALFRDLWQGHASSRFLDEKFANQILGVVGYTPGKSQIHATNAPIRGRVVFGFKRWRSREEFKQQDTQTPDIDLFIMFSPFYHFGWEICLRWAGVTIFR